MAVAADICDTGTNHEGVSGVIQQLCRHITGRNRHPGTGQENSLKSERKPGLAQPR